MKSLRDKIWRCRYFGGLGLPFKIHKQIECKINTRIRFYIQDTLVPSEDFRWQIADKVKHEIAK